MAKLSRNQENYVIMTVIYNCLADQAAGEGQPFRDVNEMIQGIEVPGVGCVELSFTEHSAFVQNCIASTLNNYGSIVTALKPYLNYKWESTSLVSRAILLMSYAHFYYVEKIDKRIVINVAIELAKKYGSGEEYTTINSVLDKVLN